jgi:hypothetical protein
MMGRIYSEAELVLAWLGTATKHSAQWERALKTIPTFNNDNHGKFKRWYKVYGPSILDLYNSPYWSRLWIVQEYTLARRVTIQCGGHKTTDESVSVLYGTWGIWLSNHGIKKRPGFSKSVAASILIQKVTPFEPATLEILIMWYGALRHQIECTEPLDRVYALLALCDSQELPECPITPDYSLSKLELYARLVQRLVNYEGYRKNFKVSLIVRGLPSSLRIEKTELDDLDPETMRILEENEKLYYDDRDFDPWG